MLTPRAEALLEVRGRAQIRPSVVLTVPIL